MSKGKTEFMYKVVDEQGFIVAGYNNATGLYSTKGGATGAVSRDKKSRRRYGHSPVEYKTYRAPMNWELIE